mmetsp:Transcript_53972/g.139422  ORF Transcript_53972/g.139422 Transcript_53972/m.139422 type:complete len:205 (-) Transcript_53972:644-1258(-)
MMPFGRLRIPTSWGGVWCLSSSRKIMAVGTSCSARNIRRPIRLPRRVPFWISPSMASQLAVWRLAFMGNRFQRLSKTFGLCAPVRRVRVRRANLCTLRAARSIASSQALCCKGATSPTAMALVASPSTAGSLQTRALESNTTRLASSRWRTRAQIATALSSLSPLPRRRGWMASTSSLARCLRGWMLSRLSRDSATRRASRVRR